MSFQDFLHAVWDWTVAIVVLLGSGFLGAFLVSDLGRKFFSDDNTPEADVDRNTMSGWATFFVIVFVLGVIISCLKTFLDCFLFKTCW